MDPNNPEADEFSKMRARMSVAANDSHTAQPAQAVPNDKALPNT